MKPTSSTALATWMLDHLTLGVRNESLSGDLLEELHSGRSTAWYWRQTLSAIAVSLSIRTRAYLVPLLFSAGWSLLYPTLWPAIINSAPAQNLANHFTSSDLPYSTGLGSIAALTPAAIFVWIGFFVYRTLRSHESRRPSTLRLLASLSISLNVLFVTIIGEHLRHFGVDLRNVSRENFDSHLAALCIPLALSLWAALMCARPRAVRRRHPSSLTA
jgi:hypothetical protein